MRLAVVAMLSLGCGSVEATATRASPITASSPSTDQRVVALLGGDGALICSGVIVAPHVVLTAAHCGSRATLRALKVRGSAVADAIVHPGYDAATQRNDLAALVVEAALSPTAPLGPAPTVGAELRIVGFGATAADGGTVGELREGRARLASLTDVELVAAPDPSLTCAGDSGGAAFAGDALVGVTSRGDAACAERSVFTRVDAARAFIDGVLAANANGAAKAGERCHWDEHCAVGACVAARDEPTIRYCSPPCPCVAPLVCNAGRCEHAPPTPGALGSSCTSECVASECRAVNGSAPICTRRCLPDVGCGEGLACVNETGAAFYCVRASPPKPEEDSGCSVGRSANHEWLALLALTLLSRRGARRG